MSYVNEVFAVVFFGIFSVFLLAIFQMKYRWGSYELLKNVVCVIMLIGFLTITLFPVPLGEEGTYFYTASNLIPFHSIYTYVSDALQGSYHEIKIQLLGNVGLFLVIQVILCWFLDLKSWRKAVAIGFGLSFSIEVIQGILGILLGSFYRSVDVDDIILNVLGSIIGYYLYRICNLRCYFVK